VASQKISKEENRTIYFGFAAYFDRVVLDSQMLPSTGDTHAQAPAVGSADKFRVYFWSYQPWRFIAWAAENPKIYGLSV
jgi:hypothetical protein